MTYSHAQVPGQRSIGAEDRVHNGRIDGGDRITSLAKVVGKNLRLLEQLLTFKSSYGWTVILHSDPFC